VVELDVERRIGELCRKAPKLAAARDRRLVVEEHAVAVAALAAAEPHRNDLSGFGIVAEAGGIRHTDELVLDERLVHLERLRHHRAQLVRIRSVGDDHEFPVDETIRARWIGRARQRHGECPRLDLCFLHAVLLLIGWVSESRCCHSRPSMATSNVATPVSSVGRCSASGWRSVRMASLYPAFQWSIMLLRENS